MVHSKGAAHRRARSQACVCLCVRVCMSPRAKPAGRARRTAATAARAAGRLASVVCPGWEEGGGELQHEGHLHGCGELHQARVGRKSATARSQAQLPVWGRPAAVRRGHWGAGWGTPAGAQTKTSRQPEEMVLAAKSSSAQSATLCKKEAAAEGTPGVISFSVLRLVHVLRAAFRLPPRHPQSASRSRLCTAVQTRHH